MLDDSADLLDDGQWPVPYREELCMPCTQPSANDRLRKLNTAKHNVLLCPNVADTNISIAIDIC